MTRKQLRTLLEGFGIDPSFRIICSGEDRATIKCFNSRYKKDTEKVLKEQGFHLPLHSDDCMNIHRYGTNIDFDIPKKYQIKKEKTYLDILGDMENSVPHKSCSCSYTNLYDN